MRLAAALRKFLRFRESSPHTAIDTPKNQEPISAVSGVEEEPQPEAALPVTPDIHPDDVFIVSYPKSGNTWLRFLVGNYVSESPIDFMSLHRFMPDLHLDPALAGPAPTKPRFIKSHSAFDGAYPRVIYILRDARDVAVSSYFHHKKFGLIEGSVLFEQFLQTFLEIGFYPNGPWDAHVEGWIGTPSELILPIKYEDMLADPTSILRKVLTFAGLRVDDARVARAVRRSSFDRMRELEAAQNDIYFRRYGSTSESIRFVRAGKAGSWQTHFSDRDLEAFMKRYGATMQKFGYE